MTAPAAHGPQEALAALERLYRKKVVSLEQAQAAAKLITGDENVTFPAPAPPPAPVAKPAEAPAAPEPEATPAPATGEPLPGAGPAPSEEG